MFIDAENRLGKYAAQLKHNYDMFGVDTISSWYSHNFEDGTMAFQIDNMFTLTVNWVSAENP